MTLCTRVSTSWEKSQYTKEKKVSSFNWNVNKTEQKGGKGSMQNLKKYVARHQSSEEINNHIEESFRWVGEGQRGEVAKMEQPECEKIWRGGGGSGRLVVNIRGAS